jgi:hypothetical protein
MIFIARRPSELHRDITANSDVVVTFQQHEPRDVLYLRSIFGPGAVAVRRLPRFRIMYFGEIEKVPLAALEAAEIEPQTRLDLDGHDALESGPV